MDLVALHQFLNDRFNESELRDLCLRLGIDYENLPGASKNDKTRELILYYQRRGSVDKLIAACRQLRSALWSQIDSTVVELAPGADNAAIQAASQLPYPLESPEGTMSPDSPFYIERAGDAIALRTIVRQGGIVTIKGPRQVGKSSLLERVVNATSKAGKQVALLDFQQLDQRARADADTFFRQFCVWLTDTLDVDDETEAHWRPGLNNIQRCTRYLERYLLKTLTQPLLLALDEVDSILDSPFRTDFFAMLRSWYNSRNQTIRRIWQQLDIALVTSTEPYQLVENLNQSPFNVGEEIALADFTSEQVADLNRRHDALFTSATLQRLVNLLGGHPFLIRLALYKVADQQLTADALFTSASTDGGPFDKHLSHHMRRLRERPDLLSGMREVARGRSCDDRVAERLQSAGLVRREAQQWLPRCQLYADYFRVRL